MDWPTAFVSSVGIIAATVIYLVIRFTRGPPQSSPPESGE